MEDLISGYSQNGNKIDNVSVRISEKYALTITEASKYFNIGQHTIRKLVLIPENNYTLTVGNKFLIKKEKFTEFLNSKHSL